MRYYNGTYVVWGPPGCGKTTSLANQVRAIVDRSVGQGGADPVLVCSLTRTAAAEIAGRDLPLNKNSVGTLHSHAYRVLGRPEVAESKAGEWNDEFPQYRLGDVKLDLDDPGAGIDMTLSKSSGDFLYEQYQLLRARCIDRPMWPESVRRFADDWEQWKSQKGGLVDYTDMIDRALHSPFNPGRPEVIIADEAQDLSELEFRLLSLWGHRAGALIVSGDPYQAIYTFRGAHPEIFQSPVIPNDHKKVLSQSYRVPKKAHACAMNWVSQLSTFQPIEYRPTDVEGEIMPIAASWRAPEPAVRMAEKYLSAGKSVMFCAACSYMLDATVAVLRRWGIPYANPWRTRRGDWNPLGGGRGISMAQRVREFFVRDPVLAGETNARCWTNAEVFHWAEILRASDCLVRGAKVELERLSQDRPNDEADWAHLRNLLSPPVLGELRALFEARELVALGEADRPMTREMTAWFRRAVLASKAKSISFPLDIVERCGLRALQETPKCYVGTIHSYKGAEADVCIIYPDLSPNGARQWAVPGPDRDSIIRCFYVALTRARETVIVCSPASAGMDVDLLRSAA